MAKMFSLSKREAIILLAGIAVGGLGVLALSNYKPQSGNLLQNGDFKEGSTSPHFWWTYDTTGNAKLAWETDTDGSKFVSVADVGLASQGEPQKSASWAQTLYGDFGGKTVRLTFYMKTALTQLSYDGGGRAVIDCYGGGAPNYTYIGGFDTPHINYNTNGWWYVDYVVKLFPKTTAIAVALSSANCMGSVGFKDVAFSVIG